MDLSSPAAFLFTDIEGSTRLWEDHPGEMAEALAHHDRLVQKSVEGSGGKVFSTAGDAFAAVFPSVEATVEAAVAAQLATRRLVAGGKPVRMRMAVHCGEVEERDDGYFGPVLNRCARLRDAAHGGQVLVSSAAAQLLEGRLPEDTTLLGLGDHRLRDLSRPEHVFQLCHPELQAEFRPLRSLAGLSTNLPIQVTSFVGRGQESAELEKLIRGSRLVTVTGAGGCGKSRLAVQVAADLLDEFGDGLWLFELASHTEPEMLASRMATELGIREQRGVSQLDALTRHLDSKTALLVVDNCEHLIGPIADLVSHLLSHTTDVRVIATSREPLRLRGEVIFQLAPLPVPAGDEEWETLRRIDSITLFAERAGAAHPGFRVTHDNARAVASICTRLDGIPLAIELAAAASRLLSPDQIADGLDDRFGLLTGGARDDVDHHVTLKAAIDWSYRLLTPDLQHLFAKLAVFVEGFTTDAVEQVCADDDLPPGGIHNMLRQLAQRSLLTTEERDWGTRFSMLETIRTYAGDLLRTFPFDSQESRRERHCRYYLSLAEEAAPRIRSNEAIAWLVRVRADLPNFHAALLHAESTGRTEVKARLAAALGVYWFDQSMLTDLNRWVTRTLDDDVPIPPKTRADLLHWAFFGLGDPDRALAFLEEELSIRRALGDRSGEALTLSNLGFQVGVFFGDSKQALSLWQQALEVSEEIGDPQRIMIAAANLADAADQPLERAKAFALRCFAAAGETGIPGALAIAQETLGHVARKGSDHVQAIVHYEKALSIHREMDDLGGVAQDLLMIADTCLDTEDLETATRTLCECLQSSEGTGRNKTIVDAYLAAAHLLLRQGRLIPATTVHGIAEAVSAQWGIPYPPHASRPRSRCLEDRTQLKHQLDASEYRRAFESGYGVGTVRALRIAIDLLEDSAN